MKRKAISRPWTVEDVSALKQRAANRTPARMIALKLGHTLAAVQARASAERIYAVFRTASISSTALSQFP